MIIVPSQSHKQLIILSETFDFNLCYNLWTSYNIFILTVNYIKLDIALLRIFLHLDFQERSTIGTVAWAFLLRYTSSQINYPGNVLTRIIIFCSILIFAIASLLPLPSI